LDQRKANKVKKPGSHSIVQLQKKNKYLNTSTLLFTGTVRAGKKMAAKLKVNFFIASGRLISILGHLISAGFSETLHRRYGYFLGLNTIFSEN